MLGVTLIEMLFVLAIIAILVTVSIMQYRHYQRKTQLRLVRYDITRIYQALNNYYHQQGCNSDSHFQGAVASDIIKQLGLPSFYASDNPRYLIQNYSAQVVLLGQTKTDQDIYAFNIKATLNPALSAGQQAWLLKALQAQRLTGGALIWQSLPANSKSQGSDQLWPLNGLSRLVKKHLNRKDMLNGASPSYCLQ